MNCPHCGTACLPEHRFCKNCGATLGAAEVHPQIAGANGATHPQSIPPPLVAAPPPGVIPGTAQAYHYVPVQTATHTSATHHNLLEGLRHRIQKLASTEDLEGFSLKEM